MAVIDRVWTPSRRCFIYHYDSDNDPNDAVELIGTRVVQKNKSFYTLQGKGSAIDRLCKVPMIDYSKSSAELAPFLRDTARMDQYQRPMKRNRITEIEAFWRPNNNNFMVNSPTIWLPSVQYDPEVDVVEHWGTRFVKFSIPVTGNAYANTSIKVVNICPVCGTRARRNLFFDMCPRTTGAGATRAQKTCEWTGKPGEIVDGQHRIRGVGWPTPPNERVIPVTAMIGDQFDQRAKAKIFMEITTKSEELHHLHVLNMVYKFGMIQTSSIGDLNGTNAAPVDFSGTVGGRRNKDAYEVATHLCEVGGIGQRWINRIELLPTPTGRSPKGSLISADKFVDLVADWFRTGRPFSGVTPIDAAIALAAYLEAILEIWPRPGGTPPGTSSSVWENLVGNAKQILQEPVQFYALLELFPEVHSRATAVVRAAPAQSDYKDQLMFLEDIDWTTSAWYDPYKAGGEPQKLLKRILHGIFADCAVPNPEDPAIPLADRRIKGRGLVNTWSQSANPDAIEWGAIVTPAGGFRAVSAVNPLVLNWLSCNDANGGHPHLRTRPNLPLNMFSRGVLVAQYAGQEYEWQIDSRATSFSITNNPFPAARPRTVEFKLKYSSSLNRSTTITRSITM